MAMILTNIALAVLWAAMTGSFTVVNVVFGFVLGALGLGLVRHHAGGLFHVRRGWHAIELALVFLRELLASTGSVSRIVLSPRLNLSPAIIAYPLSVKSDAEITLLANMITLTPGTLSVDVSEDRTTLFVHAIDAPDIDAVIAGIRASFEDRIAKVFNA